jgi:hypothetical protein
MEVIFERNLYHQVGDKRNKPVKKAQKSRR